MRLRALPLLVATAVLLAGCTAPVADDAPSVDAAGGSDAASALDLSAPTAAAPADCPVAERPPAPDGDAAGFDDAPPGLSGDGVEARRLAVGHYRALESTTFARERVLRQTTPNGTLRLRSHECVLVDAADDSFLAVTSAEGPNARVTRRVAYLADGRLTTRTAYANGTVRETTRAAVNASRTPGAYTGRVSLYRQLESLNVSPAGVRDARGRDGRLYYAATDDPVRGRAVTYHSVRLVVDEGGVVRSLSVDRAIRFRDGVRLANSTVRYGAVGDAAVPAPAWADRSR
jgi:hypothetical protein